MTVKSDKEAPRGEPDEKPTENAEEPAEAVALDFVSSNGLTKITVHFAKGPEREYWRVGNSMLCRMANGSEIQVLSDDYPRFPYASRGFFGVENVKSEHRRGDADWGKIPCQYYQGNREFTLMEKPSVHGEAPIGRVEYEAWFDRQTGLPKAYKTGGKIFLFEFPAEGPSDLVLPAEWKVALEKHQLNLRRAGLER